MKKRIAGILAILLLLCTVVPVMAEDTSIEYSVTTIEHYQFMNDLDPYGSLCYEKVEYWLHDYDGWSEEFHETEHDVEDSDFGCSNSGYQGLDEADFHYHFGHGVDEIWSTVICLWDYPFYGVVTPLEVSEKWDKDKEWVLLHSCKVLQDVSYWGAALKYTHMLLGFKTTTYADEDLPDNVLRRAVQYDYTVIDAYYYGTKQTYDSDVQATAIADTLDQWYNDHLHGHGTVAPDEYPDDDIVYYASWSC